jgi:hypothetical protein
MPREQTSADLEHWRANAHALVAAGKLQRWEIIKWATAINVALAAAVSTNKAWVQRPWMLSGFVAAVGISLIVLATYRMNGARQRLDNINTWFSEHQHADVGVGYLDVREVIFKEPKPNRRYGGLLHERGELLVYAIILVAPAVFFWWST